MTWGEFKAILEEKGVTEGTEIDSIDFIPEAMNDDDDITVVIINNELSVY